MLPGSSKLPSDCRSFLSWVQRYIVEEADQCVGVRPGPQKLPWEAKRCSLQALGSMFSCCCPLTTARHEAGTQQALSRHLPWEKASNSLPKMLHQAQEQQPPDFTQGTGSEGQFGTLPSTCAVCEVSYGNFACYSITWASCIKSII